MSPPKNKFPKPRFRFTSRKLPVDVVADISTCHITQKDGEAIEDFTSPGVVYVYAEGAVINVGCVLIDPRSKGIYSEAFMKICIKARMMRFDHIVFDADAEVYDELEKFDW